MTVHGAATAADANGNARSGPLLTGALLVVVALVFARALGGAFVYDDLALLAESPALRDPFDLVGLWTRPLWGEQLGHWRPLTAQLLALGLWLDGGGSHAIHAMALAAHLAATRAVLDLARRTGLAPTAAALVALVFAVHPAQAESVAWCAALNDVLCGAFALLGLSRWLAWRECGNARDRALAVVLAVLAALSKEPGVLVPGLYFAADLALGVSFAKSCHALAPLLLVPLGWFAARVLVFGEFAAGLSRSTYTPPGGPFGNAVDVAGGLVRHLVWPTELGMFEQPGAGFAEAAAAVGFVAIFAVLVGRAPRPSRLALGLLAFALLPPLLSVRALGPYPIADRYLYVACAGLALALGATFANARRGDVAPIAGIGFLLLAITAQRVPTWSDPQRFVAASLAQYPGDPRLWLMHAQLDLELAANDREAARRAQQSLQLAKQLLGNDLATNDHRAQVRRDVGVALAWQLASRPAANGQPDWLAVDHAFTRLTQDWPTCADAWVGLGVARAATGRLDLAERDLRHALELDPGVAPAHHNLARVLYAKGDKRGARTHLEDAVRIRPDDQASRALLDVLAREGVR